MLEYYHNLGQTHAAEGKYDSPCQGGPFSIHQTPFEREKNEHYDQGYEHNRSQVNDEDPPHLDDE